MSFTETCQRIVRDSLLSPAQKSHALALAAENALPYPELPERGADPARGAGELAGGALHRLRCLSRCLPPQRQPQDSCHDGG